MEIIVLDKLIEVYAEHFEAYANVVAEGKAVPNGDYVPFLIRVIIPQHCQQFYLNLTLLVKFLLVFQDLQSNMLLLRVRMVNTTYNYAKGTSTQLLHYFISIVNLITCIIEVISIFCIKTIIELLHSVIFLLILLLLLLLLATILTSMRVGRMRGNHRLRDVSIVIQYKGFPVCGQVHVVDYGELLHFVALKWRHVVAEPLQNLLLSHRE